LTRRVSVVPANTLLAFCQWRPVLFHESCVLLVGLSALGRLRGNRGHAVSGRLLDRAAARQRHRAQQLAAVQVKFTQERDAMKQRIRSLEMKGFWKQMAVAALQGAADGLAMAAQPGTVRTY